jgi:hypothetical protein
LIKIELQDELGRKRVDVLKEAIGARNILEVLRLRFRAWIDESFAQDGAHAAYGVQRWQPLAWSTVALRKRGGDRPLQDTGTYMKSWEAVTDHRTYVSMGTEMTPLAQWQEHGTKPYTIRVKNAKVLAGMFGQGKGGAKSVFVISGPGAGARSRFLIFGKEVHHPGIPARPVLPTRANAYRIVEETLRGMLADVARERGH